MKILLIDDEFCIRDSFGIALKDDGHQVDSANNGSDAIKLLNNNEYDILITDLDMPVMNGDQFIEITRRALLHRNKPIIVITAHSDRYEQSKIMSFGVCKYMEKPVKIEDLKRCIKECHEKYKIY